MFIKIIIKYILCTPIIDIYFENLKYNNNNNNSLILIHHDKLFTIISLSI